MGATAAILTLVNTGFSYLGQRKAANAAEMQGGYEAKILRENAGIADLEAADAISRGQQDEGRQRLATRQNIGSTRAAIAGQGVDVGYGSALDVQATEAGIGELDALTIRNNAAREAWGYQIDALNSRQQANLAELGGHNAAAGLRDQSVSTLLTGAVNSYGLYSSRGGARNGGGSTDRRGTQFRPIKGRS